MLRGGGGRRGPARLLWNWCAFEVVANGSAKLGVFDRFCAPFSECGELPTVLSDCCERPKPFHVVRQAHEIPLTADLLQPAKQKLTETHDAFDDSEHRFDRLFAFGVQLSARRGLQFL